MSTGWLFGLVGGRGRFRSDARPTILGGPCPVPPEQHPPVAGTSASAQPSLGCTRTAGFLARWASLVLFLQSNLASMYRMIVRELGGPTALERQELDEVTAGPGEVVIDVRAIGCNFFDILITEGKYQIRPELPFSPGAEVAGIVRTVGEGVSRTSQSATG